MVVTKFETQISRLESYAELVFVSITEHAAYISVSQKYFVSSTTSRNVVSCRCETSSDVRAFILDFMFDMQTNKLVTLSFSCVGHCLAFT